MRTTLALDDELLAKAQALTGLTEKSTLVREALRALIQRESARRLRGSTLHPDFRPFSESASSAGAGLTAATEKLLWWHVCNRLPQA